VPTGATTATLNAAPAVPSGLVFVDDVLIDDRLPRTVALAEGDEPTVLTLRATAQDHTTTATYRIEIVREPASPPLDVTAFVAARCVAGKVTLTVQASNMSDVAVDLAIGTPHGSKQVATLAPAKTASAAFTTRVMSIAPGEVSVTASATVGGAPASVTVPVSYPAFSCG